MRLKPQLLLLGLPLMSLSGSAQTVERYAIVIDEIMADPSPPVGLPNAEFIEVRNTSGQAITISGWKLFTSSTNSGAFPNYTLPADSVVVLTSTSNAAAFSSYGKVIGIPSFPSLANEGTVLSLVSKEGAVVHAVNYTTAWYQNAVKQEGGWSLEMIDTKNPCTGRSNWKASTDASGGTPGRKNSVDGINNDDDTPQLIRTYSLDSVTIAALFDEPLDSTSASLASHYSFTNSTILSATAQPPLFNQVIVKLSTPLQKGTVYTLTAIHVNDCKGNSIGAYNKATAGVLEEAQAADLIINEILFDPRPNTFDYVELYNKSNKILDASKLYLANRNASGAINSLKKLCEVPYSIFPGDYIVATEDALSLQSQYLVQNPANVFVLTSLPSYPDDAGRVVVANLQGDVVDEIAYSSKWHFGLISDAEGVALERIDPTDSSQNPANWHSAASTAGYGTPTYKNSQYKPAENSNASFEVSPTLFSPDNDGRDDVATISYQMEKTGYIANVTIFTSSGRLVRYFVKNATLGLKGSWNWDGLDEKNQKLPIGIYIIYAEIFNLEGKKEQFKKTIVLGRKLN